MVVIFDYNINEKIGSGSFSSIYSCYKIYNNEMLYAVKIIKLNKISEKKQIEHKIRNEINILLTLSHNNVIKLYTHFYRDNNIYLIMDKCKNTLLNEIQNKTILFNNINQKILWSNQILNGLLYIHNNNIIHRDIKPENIMIDYENNIKIIDFGFATYNNINDNILCGTLLYMAPELFTTNIYTFQTDYWATGLVLYYLLVGSLPYNIKNIINFSSTLKNIIDIKIPLNIINNYNNDLINIIESMLVISNLHRINYDEIIMHSFFINLQDSDSFDNYDDSDDNKSSIYKTYSNTSLCDIELRKSDPIKINDIVSDNKEKDSLFNIENTFLHKNYFSAPNYKTTYK